MSSHVDSEGDRRDVIAAGIGAEVRAAREGLGMSMRGLADKIGTSQPFVSNIENGRIFPSLRTLGLLAAALDVPAHRLLPGTERTERIGATSGMRTRGVGEPASRRLLGAPDRVLEAYRVELNPGESEPRPFAHHGEEYLVVIAGEFVLLREGTSPLHLANGDGLWIDGSVPHRLAGADGAGSASVALITIAGETGETGAHAE